MNSLNDITTEEWNRVYRLYHDQAVEEARQHEEKQPADVNTMANPKQAFGDKKVPLHLVPGPAMAYCAQALKEGSRKYGAFNWRHTSVEVQTYVGATMRHLMAFVDGEDMDPESGNPHLAHAIASLAILIDAIESGKVIDNRPPKGPTAATMGRMVDLGLKDKRYTPPQVK